MTEDLSLRLKQYSKKIDEVFNVYGDDLIDKLISNIVRYRVSKNFFGDTNIESINKNLEKIGDKAYYSFKCLKDYYRSQLCVFGIEYDIDDEEFYKLDDELNDNFALDMIHEDIQKSKAHYDELCFSKINKLYQNICNKVGEMYV